MTGTPDVATPGRPPRRAQRSARLTAHGGAAAAGPPGTFTTEGRRQYPGRRSSCWQRQQPQRGLSAVDRKRAALQLMMPVPGSDSRLSWSPPDFRSSERLEFGERNLAAVDDLHLLTRWPGLAAHGLDLGDDLIVALHNLAEDDVLAIQPGGLGSAEEKLAPICAGPRVGHGQDAGARVLELKVLVLELLAVDGFSPRAITLGEVTPLAHEARDDSVEDGVLVPKPLLTSAEKPEVFHGLGNFVFAKLHHDSAGALSADGHVKVHFRVGPENERLVLHAVHLLLHPRVQVLARWILLLQLGPLLLPRGDLLVLPCCARGLVLFRPQPQGVCAPLHRDVPQVP
eukprot:CAMPEP_0206056596 /NCGR_PEP_ID=MMETSP1466-20131121/42559_1 /ASSEMBLY_ACC=CAM_ASM_001126 /TAXON_ID=44452 /ORGANISM="Pavlova gyrans, Strain CCMP608" /LENGTH=341 /DNA_ID=CAMNT_0053431833 /DNA_START=89 /DNA_END=1112 /DNA_ORIENTATION=+